MLVSTWRWPLARRSARIDGFNFHTGETSTHAWLELPEPWRGNVFVRLAHRNGVGLLAGDAFAVGRDMIPHAVRINVGAARSHADLTRALSKTLAQQGLPCPKLLLLLLDDPLDDAILDHASANQGAKRRDAPAIDAQHRRDVADEGTGGDDEAQAKTGCDALGEAGDMDAPTSAPRACQ